MATYRIKQNAWGNWYGYEGRRRVIAFANPIPGYGAAQAAEEWLAEQNATQARTITIRRVAPGDYLVNNRYTLRRLSRGAGGLYDSGPAWFWRDMEQVGVGGTYQDTKAAALAELRAYLNGQ